MSSVIKEEDKILLSAAREVSLKYFEIPTYQTLYLSNMLRLHAEHYCEDFLEEKVFCRRFSVWQAKKDVEFDNNFEPSLVDYTFSHDNDLTWNACLDIYRKHNTWFKEVRLKELSLPIDYTEEDKDDPFIEFAKRNLKNG